MSSVACFLLNVVGRFLPIFVVACCMLLSSVFCRFLPVIRRGVLQVLVLPRKSFAASESSSWVAGGFGAILAFSRYSQLQCFFAQVRLSLASRSG